VNIKELLVEHVEHARKQTQLAAGPTAYCGQDYADAVQEGTAVSCKLLLLLLMLLGCSHLSSQQRLLYSQQTEAAASRCMSTVMHVQEREVQQFITRGHTLLEPIAL
jgi:hypothetical protein